MKKLKRNFWYLLLIFIELLCILALSFLIYIFINSEVNINENRKIDNPNSTSTDFLREEEGIVVSDKNTTEESEQKTEEIVIPVQDVLFQYVEIIDGCGPHFEGECLNARSGPGTEYPAIAKLRNGMVLKVDGAVEQNNETWYKIVFDEWLRYPERVKDAWYVKSDYVKILLDEGDKTIWEHGKATSTKKIIVDRSEQKLYAYNGEELFMETSISTGLELTPTPRGEFTVFKKTPSRYMQGPLPNLIDQQYYDLPGVPWNLYFTDGGAVIHGAYWHNSFGHKYSHGCVNLPVDKAYELYNWAPLGTKVIVRD